MTLGGGKKHSKKKGDDMMDTPRDPPECEILPAENYTAKQSFDDIWLSCPGRYAITNIKHSGYTDGHNNIVLLHKTRCTFSFTLI